MKYAIAIVAVLISLGLLVFALVLHPIHPHVTIVMPAPIDPPPYVLPTLREARTPQETALGARRAILSGEFSEAQKAVDAILAKDDPESDDVFNFLDLIVPRNDSAFPSALTDWIGRAPGASMPHMLRAYYFYNTGLLFRGEGYVSEVPEERMK